MKRMMLGAVFLCALGMNGSLGWAAVQYDVDMPDQILVNQTPLFLNGMGLRKATFLQIKVYVAGLYLETRSKNAEDILKSTQLKRMEMRFLRSVPKDKLVDAWSESLQKNCKPNCETLQGPITQFSGMLTSFEKDDSLTFTFSPGAVEVTIKTASTKTSQKIQNANFSQLLLLSWLGPNPSNPDLKEGLLKGSTP